MSKSAADDIKKKWLEAMGKPLTVIREEKRK